MKLGLNYESVIVRTSTLYGLLYLLESIFKRVCKNIICFFTFIPTFGVSSSNLKSPYFASFFQNNLNPDEVVGIFENEIQSLAVFYVMENLDVESVEM